MTGFYQRMFNGSPHPYLAVGAGPDFKILAANDLYLAATGVKRSQILGRNLFDVFPDNPDDPTATGVSDLRVSLERAARERQPDVMGVQKYDVPDGHGGFKARYWSPVNTPISGADGDLEFILHHVEDVTEFVLHRARADGQDTEQVRSVAARADRMQAEVLRRADEVKQANRQILLMMEELERKKSELMEANARLAELDRAKSEFFADASHELRTPLTLILGPIEELLQDEALPAEQRGLLEVARRNGLRLARQVDTVLEFSRMEGAPARRPAEPNDLAALTIELASHFRSACDAAGLGLEVDCPTLPGLVAVDADAWERIVLNLVSNAVKFTEAGGVTVRLRALERGLELTVSDTGAGIPADELPQVFERFHRVKGTRRPTVEGSGIGLALVRELARFYGGSVRVESAVGEGSTFTVVLPVTEFVTPGPGRKPAVARSSRARTFTDEAERHAQPRTAPAGRSIRPRSDRPLVLVAEDNADMRDYLVRILRRAGYETCAVADGEAALSACQRVAPALVLSDVMMPRLDGLELTRRLRADDRTVAIPVVLVSARAGEAARLAGFEAGADEYLEKPFVAAELIARIQAAVRLAQGRLELVKKDRRFAKIVSTAMDGIISIDEEQRIVLFNPAAERIFGRPAAEAIGRPLTDLIPPRSRAAHQNHVRLFAATGVSSRSMGQFGRLSALRADGTEFPIDASISKSEQDGELLFTVILRDATARVAIEDELVRERREAESATRAKAEFLANMSHEIRTPLTSIIGYSGLLEDKADLPASAKVYVNRIATGGQILLCVVNDILDFSKIEAGQAELSPRPFDPRAFIDETLDLVRAQAKAKKLRLDVKVSGAVPELVNADSDRLRQILLNLLSNAIKFTLSGGVAVEVDYSLSEGGKLSVSVIDTGIGIPEERVGRLFRRFAQVDKATEQQFGGTGLGLAIAKGVAELMGGSIGVKSQEGEGSTFWFHIAAPAAHRTAPITTDVVRQPVLTSSRVLVVEYVDANRELVAALLEPCDVEVLQAASGRAAIEQAARERFDVILMDLQLPGIDGFATTRAIRTTPGPNQETPILALTSNVMPEAVRACRQAGMNAHIRKPIDPRALLTAVAEWTATNRSPVC